MDRFTPSDRHPDLFAILEQLLPTATSVSAAVAFVTDGGVSKVGPLLAACTGPVELFARAAPVTSPAALIRLQKEFEVEVSVVAGAMAQSFHPKIWHIHEPSGFHVLSGSGNLTAPGLSGNIEQFEWLSLDADSEEAERYEARMDRLVADALPIDEVRQHTYWTEWEEVDAAQRQHRRDLKRAEEKLLSRQVRGSRVDHKQQLLADLYEIYNKTLASDLPRADGQVYRPTRFKQGLDRVANGAGDPLPFVNRLCSNQTNGFDVLLEGNRPDLTAEALVVDSAKPYHDLFDPRTRDRARERLGQFGDSGIFD